MADGHPVSGSVRAPVLASDVQTTDPHDRDKLRLTLSAEAGLNDGAAFPFVMLGLGLLGLHEIGEYAGRWWLVDVAWAVSMKFSDGYTRLGWSLVSLATLAAFVWLLGRALQVLPLGNAYAVWTGVGAVGSVLMGVWLFGETITAARLGFIVLIAVGVVGLKLTSS